MISTSGMGARRDGVPCHGHTAMYGRVRVTGNERMPGGKPFPFSQLLVGARFWEP